MTKLEPFVHVKSLNPRNRLLQTEGDGEFHNFLRHLGAAGGGCKGGGRSCECQHQLLKHPNTDHGPGQSLLPCSIEERVNNTDRTSDLRLKLRNKLWSDVDTS